MTRITIDTIKQTVVPILKRHGARQAGLFGSLVRDELNQRSDIDILVELGDELSLLGVIHLQHELEDALGRKVDLVEYKTIKPQLRERILGEQIPIL